MGNKGPDALRGAIVLVLMAVVGIALASCRLFPPVQAPFDDHRDLSASLPVFPGAEGFGTYTIAGRAGAIIRVTNLANGGTGSLREALETQGPRVVVFEVGGVIELSSEIVVRSPYLTLAGQTAPEPGITLVGSGLVVSTHDVLIQHIRSRPGDTPNARDPESRDGIAVVGDSRGETAVYNVVVDRCSVSWAIDEGMSTWYSGVRDITFSNCIVAENLSESLHPKGEHSKGVLVGDHSRRISFIGNLFAHNMRRNPLLKGDTSTLVSGNLIYNPGTQAIGFADPEYSGASRATIIGNLVIAGPDTVGSSGAIWRGAETSDDIMVFARDNLIDTGMVDTGEPAPWRPDSRMEAVLVDEEPVSVRPLTHSTAVGVETAVLSLAGARSESRDEVDERIVRTVRDRSGAIIDSQTEVGGYPTPTATSRSLDLPERPNDDDDQNGYTNLEEWLHDSAASVQGR